MVWMAWSVEHTDEFGEWYHGLSEAQQDDIAAVGLLLMEQGAATAVSLFVGDQRVQACAYA